MSQKKEGQDEKKPGVKIQDLAPSKDAKGGAARPNAMGPAANKLGGGEANRGGGDANSGGGSANRFGGQQDN